MTLKPVYKIHPSIGIARLGDSLSFFIGPEIPGLRPSGESPGTKVPPYKDGNKIKAQAARFRIFEYVDANGSYMVSREISLSEKDVTKLEWTVHLANRKASFFKFEGLAGEDRPPADPPDGSSRWRNAPAGRSSLEIDPKERSSHEIDPKERSISGKNATPVEFSKGTSKDPSSELWPSPKPSPEITTLGRLMTDDEGRLIVIGGSGKTFSRSNAPIKNYANNDGWFDDVSDGPVTVHLKLDGNSVPVDPAWVICAPPDFAPHVENVVTLYDTLYDLAARKLSIPQKMAVYETGALKGLADIHREFEAHKFTLSDYKPDFATEIYPILRRASSMKYVFAPAVGHMKILINLELGNADPSFNPKRQSVFESLRNPDAMPTGGRMPKLLGDEPYDNQHPRKRLTLTHTQYAILQQWAKGNFIESARVQPPLPVTVTPEGLDRAALENCVGGAFYPGIEVGWQIRHPSIYAEPFRINLDADSPYLGDNKKKIQAGHFSRQMALPWQADFLLCKSEGPNGWWPAQRPDSVFPSEDAKSSPWHRPTKTNGWLEGFEEEEGKFDHNTPSYNEMLDNWTKFGFIVEKKEGVFIEEEREADIP